MKNTIKIKLHNVTLLGIDCVNVERLARAMDISEKGIEFGATKLLTSLPTSDPRRVQIPHIATIEDFSKFCLRDLHNYVDTEYVLLVQYDGFVLNADSWTDDFLKYDYIGAPWDVGSWETDLFSEELKGKWVVGNGGFSIRSKRFLEVSAQLASEGKIEKYHPEDIALCVWYRDLVENEGIKFAPVELAHLFSVESKVEVYRKPFGFHGLYRENIDALIATHPDFPLHSYLPRLRKKRLQIIQHFFKNIAVEGHFFGSLAEGGADNFSDIDVWLTFKDEEIEGVLEKRLEYYAEVGDIVHVCEPPQNSPIQGAQSFVLYKTKVGLLPVDYYLCPQSTSFITPESKKLFGDVELPVRALEGYNPQKISVPETYRIDFLICFIFNGIKKLVRKNENALDAMFNQYRYLTERYGLVVDPLVDTESTFSALEKVIENVTKVANEKQRKALSEISAFIIQVKNSY